MVGKHTLITNLLLKNFTKWKIFFESFTSWIKIPDAWVLDKQQFNGHY
jgi:hypothetical protein